MDRLDKPMRNRIKKTISQKEYLQFLVTLAAGYASVDCYKHQIENLATEKLDEILYNQGLMV